MPLPIQEMGGLLEGDIRMLIEDSADRREAMLDTKLTEHRDAINKRLERTEDVVQAGQGRVQALQGDVSGLSVTIASISEDNKEQTKLLQQVVEQGRTWHEDDIAFRTDVQGRLTKIEVEQTGMTLQVKRLRWIGVTSSGIGRGGRFLFDKFCEADFWKLVAFAIFLWFIKLVSTPLYKWLSHFLGK